MLWLLLGGTAKSRSLVVWLVTWLAVLSLGYQAAQLQASPDEEEARLGSRPAGSRARPSNYCTSRMTAQYAAPSTRSAESTA